MLSENIGGAPDVDSELRKHDPASEVDDIESPQWSVDKKGTVREGRVFHRSGKQQT